MNRLVIIKFSPDITGHLTIKRKDFWKISQIRGREAKIYFKRVFSLYYHHRMPWVGSDLNNQLVPTPLHPLDLVTHGPFSYTDFEWFSFTYNWCTSCWFWLNKSKNAFHFLFTFFHFLFFVFFSLYWCTTPALFFYAMGNIILWKLVLAVQDVSVYQYLMLRFFIPFHPCQTIC